ncbi:MAG TPA: alpha/beta hydrolase [Solirubrobacteraceae bacterium]
MFGSLWQVLPHDEAGSGPAVILLHAGIADRTMWSEHLDPLAGAGFRAVAPDLSGFGEAAVTVGEQAPWIDVLATMDALEIHDAILVGNSFGGAVALRAAVVAPERVAALALISAPAPGVDPTPELEEAWATEERALERGDVDAAVAAVVRTWTLPDAPPELRDRVATMQRRAFEQQADAEEVTEAEDPVEDLAVLKKLDFPVLVAVGARDREEFQRGAEVLVEALPNARLEIIDQAGHLAPLETPDKFRQLLLRFLNEREP